MTKSGLINKIHSRNEALTKVQIAGAVDTVFDTIKSVLTEGEKKVEIRGFGIFAVRSRDRRKARNPRSGEVVEVPPKKVPYFKVGKDLKEMVEEIERNKEVYK